MSTVKFNRENLLGSLAPTSTKYPNEMSAVAWSHTRTFQLKQSVVFIYRNFIPSDIDWVAAFLSNLVHCRKYGHKDGILKNDEPIQNNLTSYSTESVFQFHDQKRNTQCANLKTLKRELSRSIFEAMRFVKKLS